MKKSKGKRTLRGPEFDGRILLIWRYGLGVLSVLLKKSKERVHLGGLEIDGRILLKWRFGLGV